jgi:uncharacterized protein (DUF58 family)
MQTNHNELVSVSLKTLIDLAQPANYLTLKFLTIRAQHNGGYSSRFKGRGMEFDEARLYQAGDDIRSIDWRVTARTGKAHTKLFREERERPVFISVDKRQTMYFATRGVFKSVLSAKLAGLLAWSAHHHGDRIGGQFFNDAECKEIKPQNGKRAVLHFLNELTQDTKNPLITDNTVSLEKVFMRLNQHAHTGSLIYIISDFRGFNELAKQQLIKLAQHSSIVLIFVSDKLESKLPQKGLYRFTDGAKEISIDSSNKKLLLQYQQQFAQRQQQLIDLAKNKGFALLRCHTTDDPITCLR